MSAALVAAIALMATATARTLQAGGDCPAGTYEVDGECRVAATPKPTPTAGGEIKAFCPSAADVVADLARPPSQREYDPARLERGCGFRFGAGPAGVVTPAPHKSAAGVFAVVTPIPGMPWTDGPSQSSTPREITPPICRPADAPWCQGESDHDDPSMSPPEPKIAPTPEPEPATKSFDKDTTAEDTFKSYFPDGQIRMDVTSTTRQVESLQENLPPVRSASLAAVAADAAIEICVASLDQRGSAYTGRETDQRCLAAFEVALALRARG